MSFYHWLLLAFPFLLLLYSQAGIVRSDAELVVNCWPIPWSEYREPFSTWNGLLTFSRDLGRSLYKNDLLAQDTIYFGHFSTLRAPDLKESVQCFCLIKQRPGTWQSCSCFSHVTFYLDFFLNLLALSPDEGHLS